MSKPTETTTFETLDSDSTEQIAGGYGWSMRVDGPGYSMRYGDGPRYGGYYRHHYRGWGRGGYWGRPRGGWSVEID